MITHAVVIFVQLGGIGDEWADVHEVAESIGVAVRKGLTDALTFEAEVCFGAGVAIVTSRSVGLGRARALAGDWIAHAGILAGAWSRAGDGTPAQARPGHTGVALCASIAVVASRAVRTQRVGALAGGGIAHPSIAALIRGSTDHRI